MNLAFIDAFLQVVLFFNVKHTEKYLLINNK